MRVAFSATVPQNADNHGALVERARYLITHRLALYGELARQNEYSAAVVKRRTRPG